MPCVRRQFRIHYLEISWISIGRSIGKIYLAIPSTLCIYVYDVILIYNMIPEVHIWYNLVKMYYLPVEEMNACWKRVKLLKHRRTFYSTVFPRRIWNQFWVSVTADLWKNKLGFSSLLRRVAKRELSSYMHF